MNISTLSSTLRRQGLPLWSAADAALLFPSQDPRLLRLQLHQWSRKGWVRRLKRGLYELAYPEPSVLPDLRVANRLYEPSYVSLETALSHYQLLPETAAQVTSVSPKPTRRFKNAHGLFTYFTVRPRAFAGYRVIRLQDTDVLIAEPEKAVMDHLYAAFRRGALGEAALQRWDRPRLRKLDHAKLASYAALFGTASPKLKEALDALL